MNSGASVFDFGPWIETIASELEAYRSRGQRMFASSSFQTNSVVLLHLLSRLAPEVPVVFLNTGYHFPETLGFRDALAREFGLRVVTLAAGLDRSLQRDRRGRLLFASDPDHCCHINKVAPMEPMLIGHDVWINGVRGTQSAVRERMMRETPAAHGAVRYHPILDWTAPMVEAYIEQHALPRHPLEAHGYFSVGCRPCTRKLDPEALYDDRTGRWFGMKKTECGLHTDLAGEST